MEWHLPTMLTFLVPESVPGSPVVVSLHSMTKPSNLRLAMKLSVDIWQDEPATTGLLLAALRSLLSHTPLEEGAGGAHGWSWGKVMKSNEPEQFVPGKTHLVLENVPVTTQVHDTLVPGQRGCESEASHVRFWAWPGEM